MAAVATVAVLRSVAALRAQLGSWRAAGETIALVPTMGALHAGHLALVAAGQAACRRTIVSIFVNPTQFGPKEDFASYPRDEAGDLAKLASARVDAAYVPALAEIYPPGFSTSVAVGGLTETLCGPLRPGHFTGVATVVSKLLLQATPDAAFFGEKDYQQLQVVKRLARDLDLGVRIEGVATVREPDGLALSSRNVLLTAEERRKAPLLHEVLERTAAALADGKAAAPVLAAGRAALEAGGFGPVQYLELRHAGSLLPLAALGAEPARLLAAAYLGKVRLIDNVPARRARS